MIRLVRIDDQIDDLADQIAFFDTVTGKFVEIAGKHVFDSRADLDSAINVSLARGEIDVANRFRGHIPDNWDSPEGRRLIMAAEQDATQAIREAGLWETAKCDIEIEGNNWASGAQLSVRMGNSGITIPLPHANIRPVVVQFVKERLSR